MKQNITRCIGRFVCVTALALSACNRQSPSSTQAPASSDAPQGRSLASGSSCGDLAKLSLPNTTITAADDIAVGAFVPPAGTFSPPAPPGAPTPYAGLPPFCRVSGTIAPVPGSEIHFEVWLPKTWNGKFIGVGNGGAAGLIFYFFMAEPLTRGYAVAATDAGHSGGLGDWSFAVHREKLIDFGYRAIHEMTEKSKAVVEAHYGTAANRSYWNGCSQGGRQGLEAAHRFPEDYDGIVAGAPAINLAIQSIRGVLIQQATTNPAERVTPDKLKLMTEAAIAACDAGDGVRDRTVTDPRACTFDPGVLACKAGDRPDCLTPRQVAWARQIYSGIRDQASNEQISQGLPPTSEVDWVPPPFVADMATISTSYFRHVISKDPIWDPARLDLDADGARARTQDNGIVSLPDPDLSAFVRRGGKLLLWHGWSDGALSPLNTIDYYNNVIATTRENQASNGIRLFMAPGVQHCGGGEGPSPIDLLSVIEAWVESGKAPERVIASRPLERGRMRTRPLCPYPQLATYTGQGSSDDAASFVCKAPSSNR
jgi:feruloyl esterase